MSKEIPSNKMSEPPSERETQQLQANREELIERIARAIPQDGTAQPLKGIHLYRRSIPRRPVPSVVDPSLCVIAQGSKEVLIGESRYRYDPAHYLLATVELPHIGQVLEASKERPYLALRLELSPTVVGSVLVEAAHTVPQETGDVRAVSVNPLDRSLLEAILRLVRLIDAPTEVPVIMPLVTREIIYRLLVGNQGSRLRHLAVLGGYSSQVARAVDRLQHEFDQPLRIEQMAKDLGMSVSSLHHHFKAVTAMSPLQFQKQLRLQEARRLMLGDDLDAASAAFRVGYNDASQFNREYKSLFGDSPIRDVQRLREETSNTIANVQESTPSYPNKTNLQDSTFFL